MPKIIDLPEALSAADEDVMFIDDVAGGVSKKITKKNFSTVIFNRQLLGGTAQGGLEFDLIDGDPITWLTNFTVALGSAGSVPDPVTGIISEIQDIASKIIANISCTQTSNVVKDAGLSLWVEIDDSIAPPHIAKIGEQWAVHVNQIDFLISSAPISILSLNALSPPHTLRFGLQALAKDLSITINATQFMTEAF